MCLLSEDWLTPPHRPGHSGQDYTYAVSIDTQREIQLFGITKQEQLQALPG